MRRAHPALPAVHTIAFDFDGVLTDNKVWVDQSGKESVRCDRADGLGFNILRAYRKRGLLTAEFFILSMEANPVVLARAKKLGVECYQGIGDKLAFMRDHLAARFPDRTDRFAGLVYVGNDLNDLPVMRRAGYSVAPADAHPKVREVAHLVLEQSGGNGFVRAFIELLLDINQLSSEELDELVSDR